MIRHSLSSLAGIALALCMVAGLSPQLAARQVDAGSERLPTHPELVFGQLDNGLTYMIKPHANPPGRVSLRLHIAAGSLQEKDEQRGLAHYLEHLAFNGSENFAPGELIPFFESIGLTFGRHQNAFTSFDQTVYMLDLPNTEDETVTSGFLFLSDVLGRLLLLEEEIENERPIILEEKRSGLGPDQRVMEQVLPRITEGSLLAERLPIGVEETIRGANREIMKDYYDRWYTTGNATVIVVGDMEADAVIELLEKNFGDLEAGPRPDSVDVGRVRYEESFAVVATDPELTRTDISLVRIEDTRGPTQTVADFRRDLVEQVGAFVFNRRLQARVSAGEVAFRSGTASMMDLFSSFRYITASATGESEKWREMLFDLVTELERARAFGFTERELDDARRALTAQMRQFSMMENTLPASLITQIILQGVNEGEPVMSATQQLELMERLLPDFTVEEVSTVFRNAFTPERTAFVVQTPEGEHVPTEREVLDAGEQAVATELAAIEDDDRPENIMETLPSPGRVAEMTIHPESEVFSAWLDNGVRVHHRFMDYRENQATIRITLGAGSIEETAATRGLTRVAGLAFSRPATSSLTSTNIRDLLTGVNVSVGGSTGVDTVSLTVSGAPEDLEPGMQVAHLLLTAPRIEEAAFAQWKQQQIQSIEARQRQPMQYISEVIPDVLYPKDDPRWRPLTTDEVRSLSLSDAQGWLDVMIARAPIEVAVVGHIEREEAINLVRRYVGSLPSRARISKETLYDLREISRPEPPLTREVEIETQTPQAMVVVGFFGSDADDLRDTRLMRMASQIMSTRMIKRIREEEGLVYSIGAFHQPGVTIPGFGLFMSAAPTEPGQASQLADVIEEMFAEFAEEGPTETEIAVAQGQIANDLDETMKEPGFWSGQLSDMSYRGRDLNDLVAAPTAYDRFTASDVHQAFRKYHGGHAIMRIIVRPAGWDAGGQ
ncbi:MAG: insulinase family protein [Phycisphaeraceae bacterium]|nr:MAG: insulinase family protein [Phycisphaeraceae bacterium]